MIMKTLYVQILRDPAKAVLYKEFGGFKWIRNLEELQVNELRIYLEMEQRIKSKEPGRKEIIDKDRNK